MAVFQYKSFSLSSLFILVLVTAEYGCGETSKRPIIPPDLTTFPDGGTNSGQGGASLAGTGYSEGTGGIVGTAGQPIAPGSGGGPAGNGGTNVADSGSQAPPCFNAGTDPNRNQVQPGNICDRLSTIQCAAEACCCDIPGRDFNACKQGMIEYCREHLQIDALSSDNSTGFDLVIAEQVFSEYEEKASRCDISVVNWGTSMAGLRGIIKGTIDPGQPCTPEGEWGETLNETGATALASCTDPAHTACSHPAPLLWICSPRVDVGLGCITDLNCLEGLYCDNPNLMLLGAVCRPRKNIDSPCASPNECQSLICKNGACAEVNQQNVFCLSE